jgi:hypothetical protein
VVTCRRGDGTRPVLLLHRWQSRASRYAGFVPATDYMVAELALTAFVPTAAS